MLTVSVSLTELHFKNVLGSSEPAIFYSADLVKTLSAQDLECALVVAFVVDFQPNQIPQQPQNPGPNYGYSNWNAVIQSADVVLDECTEDEGQGGWARFGSLPISQKKSAANK